MVPYLLLPNFKQFPPCKLIIDFDACVAMYTYMHVFTCSVHVHVQIMCAHA